MSPLEAGTQAPDFSLSDQDGNQVRLAGLRGKKVLIYFYPKAMTPGCTTQACGLRDVNSELTALNVVVLGISPDSAKRLKKFEERDNLNFRLLAGIHRLSFLIDEEGKVAHRFDKFKTSDHHQVVLDLVKG